MRRAAPIAWLLCLLVGAGSAVRAEGGVPSVITARVDADQVRCDSLHDAAAQCARDFLNLMRAGAERAYVETHGLAAAEPEIDAVFAYQRAFRSHDRTQRARKLVQLGDRLASDALTADERTRLEAFRSVLVRLARFDADVDAGIEQTEVLPRATAAAWVEQAKLDAALYRRFGGVVGVRASGLYAHGARLELLRRHLMDQRTECLDPAFTVAVERALDSPPAIVHREGTPDFTPFWLRPIPASYMLD